MTELTKIEKTVKALLAKANGSENEHEAAAFIEKAHELLSKHNLDLSRVTRETIAIDVKVIERKVDVYHKHWQLILVNAISKLYFCKIIAHTFVYRAKNGKTYLVKGVTYIGKPHNTEIAESMADYLIKTVTRLSKNFNGSKAQFEVGCSNRIATRIWAMYDAAQAATNNPDNLPVLYANEEKQVEAFMERKSTKQGKVKKLRYDDDYYAGLSAGNEVNLNTQVSNTKRAMIALMNWQ